jgi:hypothetical protein
MSLREMADCGMGLHSHERPLGPLLFLHTLMPRLHARQNRTECGDIRVACWPGLVCVICFVMIACIQKGNALQYCLLYPTLVNPVISLNRSKTHGVKSVN